MTCYAFLKIKNVLQKHICQGETVEIFLRKYYRLTLATYLLSQAVSLASGIEAENKNGKMLFMVTNLYTQYT